MKSSRDCTIKRKYKVAMKLQNKSDYHIISYGKIEKMCGCDSVFVWVGGGIYF